MKRKSTVAITLALLGSAGLLSSCGEDPIETSMFKDAASCVASGQYTQQQCDEAIQAAQIDNQKNAPAFANQKDCEETFGAAACQQSTTHPSSASNGGISWIPPMAGFMMGRMSAGSSNPAIYPQAVYQDRDRKYMNGGGAFIARNFGSVKVTPDSYTRGTSAKSAPTRTTTISRNGFGRSSFSVGG